MWNDLLAKMPALRLRLLAALAALVLTSCASPDQGDHTSAADDFGIGAVLHSAFATSSDFAGNPLAAGVSVRPPPQDFCEATAQNRAQDIAAEGYDATLQQHVHDSVLADCRIWSKRR